MKSIPKDEPIRSLQVRIADSLFRGAKIEAARRDTPLSQWVAGAISEKLLRDNPTWLKTLPKPESDAA